MTIWMKPARARDITALIDGDSNYCWNVFNRDYAQVVHADFFRRLAGKTQVHSLPTNDHIRTRLTHSIEVSQIGRQIARYFCFNMNNYNLFQNNDHKNKFTNELEELTAAACMLHDTGHPPFGHVGAKLLNKLADQFSEEFDDNKQIFRVALNGIWNEKFDPSAPLIAATAKKIDPSKVVYKSELKSFRNIINSLGLEKCRHPASFFMEAADDIAYIAADFADFLRYFSNPIDLQKMKDNNEIIAISQVLIRGQKGRVSNDTNLFGLLNKIDGNKSNRSDEDILMFTTELIRSLLLTVFENIDIYFKDYAPKNINEIPNLLTQFSNEKSYMNDNNLLYLTSNQNGKIFFNLKKTGNEKFILDKSYIGTQNMLAHKVLNELFQEFSQLIRSNYESCDLLKILPYDFRGYLIAAHNAEKGSSPARAVIDFLAGMTDEFAVKLWESINRPHLVKRVA
jgi:dGTP triphosphohydrolase